MDIEALAPTAERLRHAEEIIRTTVEHVSAGRKASAECHRVRPPLERLFDGGYLNEAEYNIGMAWVSDYLLAESTTLKIASYGQRIPGGHDIAVARADAYRRLDETWRASGTQGQIVLAYLAERPINQKRMKIEDVAFQILGGRCRREKALLQGRRTVRGVLREIAHVYAGHT